MFGIPVVPTRGGLVLLKTTVTQYCDVMELESTTPAATSRQPSVRSFIAALVVAILVGLGVWAGSSFIKDSDGVSTAENQMTAAQHTVQLVRSLRVSAASDITPEHIDSIPDAAAHIELLDCGSRFTSALEDAVIQLHGVDYLSSVAGSRSSDAESWRLQQSQAHDGAIAVDALLADDCSPDVPIVFDLDHQVRFSEEISIRQNLLLTDDLVEEWTQLYLLAESVEERNIALAGLWQVIAWESSASPGRSPFAFEF